MVRRYNISPDEKAGGFKGGVIMIYIYISTVTLKHRRKHRLNGQRDPFCQEQQADT